MSARGVRASLVSPNEGPRGRTHISGNQKAARTSIITRSPPLKKARCLNPGTYSSHGQALRLQQEMQQGPARCLNKDFDKGNSMIPLSMYAHKHKCRHVCSSVSIYAYIHTYIYLYICISYISVCMCVCLWLKARPTILNIDGRPERHCQQVQAT